MDHFVRHVPRWVLSGGPKSGKTTLMNLLMAEFGDVVLFHPEMATFLHVTFGIKVPVPGTPEHHAYSRQITHVQVHLEDALDQRARAEGKLGVVCDRGIVDSIAYLEGGDEEFERVTGIRASDARRRYDRAVVLELAPRHVFEDRGRGDNTARRETYDEAVPLDARTHGVWRPHEGSLFVGNEGGWSRKQATALAAFRGFIAEARNRR